MKTQHLLLALSITFLLYNCSEKEEIQNDEVVEIIEIVEVPKNESTQKYTEIEESEIIYESIVIEEIEEVAEKINKNDKIVIEEVEIIIEEQKK